MLKRFTRIVVLLALAGTGVALPGWSRPIDELPPDDPPSPPPTTVPLPSPWPPPPPPPGTPPSNDWLDGCTTSMAQKKPALQIYAQHGLDAFFLGACTHHDLCYSKCNGPEPPFLDNSHRWACNLTFWAEMEEACAYWATVIAYPLDAETRTAEEFLQWCSVAAAGIFSVETFYDQPYWNGQCERGCNRDACVSLQRYAPTYLPGTCGNGPRPAPDYTPRMTNVPSYCYVWEPPAPPPPPPTSPPPLIFDPCMFVSCFASCGCTWEQQYCCGGCLWDFWNWDPWDWEQPVDPFGPICFAH